MDQFKPENIPKENFTDMSKLAGYNGYELMQIIVYLANKKEPWKKAIKSRKTLETKKAERNKKLVKAYKNLVADGKKLITVKSLALKMGVHITTVWRYLKESEEFSTERINEKGVKSSIVYHSKNRNCNVSRVDIQNTPP